MAPPVQGCYALANPDTSNPKIQHQPGATSGKFLGAGADTTTIYADFGREFQGGLALTVGDGVEGQTVEIACGESMKGKEVTSDWGWDFTWTLRGGAQVLEQHKYMECRFVSMKFTGTPPSNMTLSAWQTHYPYVARFSFTLCA